MTATTSNASGAPAMPDYAPVPPSALGPAFNEQGYRVGRVERNLFWVTDGTYQSTFLPTDGGVVLFDAPPTIGHNLRRAVDSTVAAEGVTNQVTHLVYSHHHADLIAKYTGVLAEADVEAFTYSTTFTVMQSLRLDLGAGSQVHP